MVEPPDDVAELSGALMWWRWCEICRSKNQGQIERSLPAGVQRVDTWFMRETKDGKRL